MSIAGVTSSSPASLAAVLNSNTQAGLTLPTPQQSLAAPTVAPPAIEHHIRHQRPEATAPLDLTSQVSGSGISPGANSSAVNVVT